MSGVLDFGSQKFLDLLTPEIQAAIEAVEHRHSYRDGRTIFSTGDAGDRLMIIRSGAVRMARLSPGGREVMMGVFGPGHFIGILSVLTNRKRTHNAVAVGETTVGYVDNADLLKLMAEHPQMANAVLPATLSRLDVALRMLDDLRMLPLTAYTAVFIQNNLASTEGSNVLHTSQSELALAVGASRVSVGKALKQLEAEGLIALKYGAIEVLDPQALSDWIDAARADHLAP